MSFRERHAIPDFGVGVGFRPAHVASVLDASEPVDVQWFEVISESFLGESVRAAEILEQLRARHAIVPHGVSLGIGSVEPLDDAYLTRLAELVRRIDPPWVSDHLSWGRLPGVHLHELLPLPYTREALDLVVERVKRVQGNLERPFALENVSSYLTYRDSTMTEWEFLAEVAERADCGILLDCNNVYVSARNHGFDSDEYIDAIPAARVVQLHLAGHADKGTHLLDTHSDHVSGEVWSLYRKTIARVGAVSTLIEWDEDIPSWDVLLEEVARASSVRTSALAEVR